MMTPREACIAFNLISGIGYARFRALADFFGSPESVFEASKSDLMCVPGVGEQLAGKILSFNAAEELEKEVELAARSGVHIFTLFDKDYPEDLRLLRDPPLCLYWRGKMLDWSLPRISVIGSRRLSGYGERMTASIAADAAASGCVIISGLALGADTIAHTMAVKNGKPTIGVIGGGMLHFYPKENLALAKEMVENGGAVLSEYPLDFPVHRTNFPRRNRIVAALSKAVIVTEAGLQSGALITARDALALGKDIFALPGHADNPQAQGCHQLIREGATLIERFSDVVESMDLTVQGAAETSAAGEKPLSTDGCSDLEKMIFDYIAGKGEASLEELSTGLNAGTGELISGLMKLELKLLITRGDDQLYRCSNR